MCSITPATMTSVAVGQGVDVDLDRPPQIAVQQHRLLLRHRERQF
jgi:hypothetical protein